MNKSTVENYLSSHAFFAGLDDSFLNFLAESVTEVDAEKGRILFQQGKPADKFYLLRSGLVSVQIPAIMGPTLEIQTLTSDQLLGWSWLIPPYRWNFLARVMEDTNLLEFDGKAILARCEEDPKFGYELFKRFAALMSQRLDAARQKLIDQWDPPGFA